MTVFCFLPIISFNICIVAIFKADNQMISQNIANDNRVQSKRFKFASSKKATNKQQTSKSQSSIGTLKFIKNSLESLPSHSNYLLQHETDYLRQISQVLPLMSKVRLQQMTYIISTETFKKIIIQFVRQRQHKQIVMALLKELTKGIEDYRELVESELYQILEIMVDMQALGAKLKAKKEERDDFPAISGRVQALGVYELIKNIIRWYGTTLEGRGLSLKYKKLLLAFQN